MWSVLQNVQVAERACQPRRTEFCQPAVPFCANRAGLLSLGTQALVQNSWARLQALCPGKKAESPPSKG